MFIEISKGRREIEIANLMLWYTARTPVKAEMVEAKGVLKNLRKLKYKGVIKGPKSAKEVGGRPVRRA
jgi:hypothetical protein